MSSVDDRRQPEMRQILFIQGGGAGAHDEWDDKLVVSLQRELGSEYEVRYPRMPNEDDPSSETWGPAIRSEVAVLPNRAVVVAHSVGATLLVRALVDQRPRQDLKGHHPHQRALRRGRRLARRGVRVPMGSRREVAAGPTGSRNPRARRPDCPAGAC